MSVCLHMSLCSAVASGGARKDEVDLCLRTQSYSHIEGDPSLHADVYGRPQRPSVGSCGLSNPQEVLYTPVVGENRPGSEVGVCRQRTCVLRENIPRALRACSEDIAGASAVG